MNIYKYIVKCYNPNTDKDMICEGYCFGETMSAALAKVEEYYGKDCVSKICLTEKGYDFDNVLETKCDGEEVKVWNY